MNGRWLDGGGCAPTVFNSQCGSEDEFNDRESCLLGTLSKYDYITDSSHER